jgi:hypothetical protein
VLPVISGCNLATDALCKILDIDQSLMVLMSISQKACLDNKLVAAGAPQLEITIFGQSSGDSQFGNVILVNGQDERK